MEITTKRIFSDEEIEGLKNLYLNNNWVEVKKEQQNLKNVFLLSCDPKDLIHFTKKICPEGEPDVTYFVEYTAGSWADPHIDKIEKYSKTLTTITHINDMSEYTGGSSILENKRYRFEKGTTVYFDGLTKHGVDKVISGSRLVFVTWFGIE